jgi:hypothetical protein
VKAAQFGHHAKGDLALNKTNNHPCLTGRRHFCKKREEKDIGE